MTLRKAFVIRCVIWRMFGWTCSRITSSGSARTMSAAGPKALFATSSVGARMYSSAECRQFRISAVNMIPAARVDLPFFLLISRKNSLISRWTFLSS